MGLDTSLNLVLLLNYVKPIKIPSIKGSIVKISPSKNQARLPIHFLSKQESSKIFKKFLHTKQESSNTTVAREGSIKIKTRVLAPKSLRSRISSKPCSSLS
jgi:hypothetical protein